MSYSSGNQPLKSAEIDVDDCCRDRAKVGKTAFLNVAVVYKSIYGLCYYRNIEIDIASQPEMLPPTISTARIFEFVADLAE